MRSYLTFFKWPLYLMVLLLWLSSCANYKMNYSREGRNWEARQPDPSKKVAHTMYLIGDAGDAQPGSVSPALRLLEQRLKEADPNSSVVFLGDNIYPNGLAPENEAEERQQDEYRLTTQLDAVKDFKGRPFFLAGNHDWYEYGIDGLKRQKDFIEKYLGRSDVWEPNGGCSGPEEIELGENLVLLIVDSQWWLADWKGEPEINEDCLVKSRQEFWVYFEDEIKGNREKNIVIAMHHPLYSNGPHGGQFTLKEHLFPLTKINENFYLPLPVIGSLYPFLRSTVGSKQDIAHPDYRALRELMINSARKNGSYIFVSGHEHSLQYLEKDDQFFIVSGAGSKRSAAKVGNDAEFAYGGYGFVQLDFYEDGTVWANYWATQEEGESGRVVFRKKIKGPLGVEVTGNDPSFEFYESGQDSIVLPVSERDYTRKGLGKVLWGEHFRETYRLEIKVPVLDLATFEGGLIPVEKGGGYQTNSLRLETKDGRQYNIRSVDKDPTRTVIYPLSESQLVLNAVIDGFSAAHPFAALPLPALSDAAGVYHTNPKIVYVPKQPRLGPFNDGFGDALYLLEERPDGKVWSEKESFGKPKDILSTEDAMEDILDDHEEFVDYPAVVRSRVFDLLIGDWDRHDDQWRWSEIDSAGMVYYRPIPRDRDQAFSKYDGFLYFLARNSFPAARPLRPYKGFQKNIKWSNFGSRHFDNTFLVGTGWEEWEKQVRYIQQHVTDEVIERAFRESLPKAIYEADARDIISILKERRENLMVMTREFYEFLSREVDIAGTTKRDLFEVERRKEGETVVRVYDTNKEGEKEMLLFERVFDPGVTKEIALYGLGDEDIFRVEGDAGKGIELRLVGGVDKDSFIDHSRVGGWSKKTKIYDGISENNILDVGKETSVRISDDPKFNIYNRRSLSDYQFDYWFYIPSLASNPDDGLLLGASAMYTHFGYKKVPHAGQHLFAAKYAFGTSGIELQYESEFVDAVGDWELHLEGLYRSPLYSINFYGFGNETVNPEDSLGKDYNRVRQQEIRFYPSLMKISNSATRFSFGPTFEAVEVERTEERFIDQFADGEDGSLDSDFFGGQEFLGVRFIFDYSNLSDPAFPSLGLNLYVDAGWKFQLANSSLNFPYLEGYLSAFQPLDSKRRLVLGTRIGGRYLFNNKFEFYQGARLGGTGSDANFRGFRRDRFTGKSAFYQNIDLRWEALRSGNRLLPFAFGLLAGFDHGRVWLEEDDSKLWHYSYGGGFFIEPLDMFSAQFSLFNGDGDQWLFVFGGRFFF